MSLAAIGRKIIGLEVEMAAAAAREDFERAAALRNEILELKGQVTTSLVRQPPPGQMGLGTHIPTARPPENWTPPKKPDPMTANHRAGGRRSK